jgi:hypothetical protein
MLIPLSISIASIKILKKYDRKNRAMQSHDREYIDRLQMNEIPYLQITIPD